MISPIQQRIRDKRRTVKQIVEMIKPGEWKNPGSIGGDSMACMDGLAERLGPGPGDLKDLEIWSYGTYNSFRRLQEIDPEEQYHCIHHIFSSHGTGRRATAGG